MKKIAILLFIALIPCLAPAASLPNQPRTPFIIIDRAPPPPPPRIVNFQTLFMYMRWAALYRR